MQPRLEESAVNPQVDRINRPGEPGTNIERRDRGHVHSPLRGGLQAVRLCCPIRPVH